MIPELHKDMPMSQYQASHEYLSKTMLSVGADCWQKFKYQFVDGNYKSKDTDSLRIGSAVHTLALEPEKWHAEYHVLPEDYDGRTKAGKEMLAEAEATGKKVLKASQVADVYGMAEAIKNNPLAIGLLKSAGYVEASIFWEKDGVKMKCRPDLMRNDGLIVDIKTCQSANPRIFSADAYKFKYPLSVAITCEGYAELYGKMPEEYVFLCVESTEPFIISAFSSFQSSEGLMSVLEYGQMQLEKLRTEYKRCVETGVWPAYQSTIEPLKLPSWVGV